MYNGQAVQKVSPQTKTARQKLVCRAVEQAIFN